MIIRCDKCNKTLKYKGAILYGPPWIRFVGEKESSEKWHFCGDCYNLIIDFIKNGK